MINEGFIDAVLPLSATLLPGTKWNHENKNNLVNEKIMQVILCLQHTIKLKH